MAQVVYVKEYQPSSATLRIGGDPIYRESMKVEYLTVGAPFPSWLILPIGVLLWLLVEAEDIGS